MEAKRKVNFRVFFDLLKSRGALSVLGLIFTTVALFIFLPTILILSMTLRKPYEKYNFNEIESKGTKKIARISNIDTIYNVSDNGQHPQVITYIYENGSILTTDKFETIQTEKTSNFSIGKQINILSYQDESMIEGVKPYQFPVEIFYIFPVLFFLIGITVLTLGLIPALKTFSLYKYGVVKDAYIISTTSNSGFFLISSLRSGTVLNYYFFDDFNNKVFGESHTSDLMILNGKKPGDQIKVFVSEQDESKSCLVPGLETMKYNWNI